MRILMLSRYDQLGASSRLRMLQYIPWFEKMGAKVTVSPLFDDKYLCLLYKSKNRFLNRFLNLGKISTYYFKRLHSVLFCKNYDVVWIEKEIFPYCPGLCELILSMRGIKYVVDYDDAIFHNYDLASSFITRFLLKNKLKPLLSNSSAVTAGNQYLANLSYKNCANSVYICPTVVDINRYMLKHEPIDETIRIGWIGSSSTSLYLKILAEPLRRVALVKKIIFVTIGAPKLSFPGVLIEQHDWTLETEVSLLNSIHIGVMPLFDSPWERGKCGYKLIQYMALGKPVIASPVGVNHDIVTPDVGYLADSDASWKDALIKLIEQPTIREQFGKAARTKVEQKYSLQVTQPIVFQLFKDLINKKSDSLCAD